MVGNESGCVSLFMESFLSGREEWTSIKASTGLIRV